MKTTILLLLALFALGNTQDDCSEDRVEERVFDCLGNIMVNLLSGVHTEEETCAEVKTMQNCLETVIDECLDDEQRVEVDKELQQFTDMLGTNCPISDGKDAAEACAEENKDYIMECLTENQLNAIAQFGSNSNLNENRFKCTLYSLIADCVTQRVGEKCGDTARDLVREELNDPPQEIKEACDAADDIVLTDFESLLTKKKK
ncbi:uncharacterized protein [Parasteatoda tepidariorum]|uniref:uncharacterized protein n=1 Tax=Parasteatoda tepidariorum TaxID=114398 RepID=UPI00077FA0AF|nr:uncharacterized protein LOC107457077 [Parasteatoda tepidariorum]